MQQKAIILAMDVSGSMRVTDVKPSRLDEDTLKKLTLLSGGLSRLWFHRVR